MFMQLNLNTIHLKSYSPSFSSCSRDVNDSDGKFIHRNDTSMFRSDIGRWDSFVNYLDEKYKNIDKVNIYSLSSSAGDEVYSLAIKLLEKYGETNSQKFFPIKASDYDEKIIKMAQAGYLPMYEEDEEIVNENTNGKFNKYFEKTEEVPDFIKNMDIEFDFLVKVKPILRNKIQFSVANATEACQKVKPDNSFIMVRNFWPYLKDETTRIKLAQDLYKTLGENSAVMLGKFDDTSGAFASKNLYDAGFVCHPELYTIFEKNNTPYPNYYY